MNNNDQTLRTGRKTYTVGDAVNDISERLSDSPIADGIRGLRGLRSGLPDLRSKAKIEEDEANEAVAAGTATPEQQALVESNRRLLNSAAGNNPFDTPVMPFHLGGAATQAGRSILGRAGDSLRSGVASVRDSAVSIGRKVQEEVAEPISNAAANAVSSLRGVLPNAAPAAGRVANPNIVPGVGSAEAAAFRASQQPTAAVASSVARTTADDLTVPTLRGPLARPITAAGVAGAASTNGAVGEAQAASPATAAISPPEEPAAPLSPTSFESLRGGMTRQVMENGSFDMDAANANAQDSLRGMRAGIEYNLGRRGGNADITATRGADGRLTISGTGEGSSGYENSQQYRDGVARAAADRARLSAIESENHEQRLMAAVRDGSTPRARRDARETLKDFREARRESAKYDAEATRSLRSSSLDVAKFRAEQANKDREFGQKQEETELKQRQDAESKLTDRLSTMLRARDADGKDVADTAKVADYTRSINALIGQRISALRAIPKDDPRYAQAQSEAEGLSRRGIAQLDDAALTRIVAQLGVRDRAAAGHSSFNPFASTFRDSPNPDDYTIVGVEKGALQDQYVTRNGTKIPVNDLRYTEPANTVLPDVGKVRTSRYDPAFEKGLRK